MKSVVQRVARARLEVDGVLRAEVPGPGLVVLVGIEATDTDADLAWTADKLPNLRIFPDDQGKMNRSLIDIAGTMLLIPNFTLAGDAARGRRPSFDRAMKPDLSEPAFTRLVELSRAIYPAVTTGVFRAHMHVDLTNDGPVTLILDSRDRAAKA